ncbi:MAG: hypothetical protein U0L79_09840 [Lachnospiraceae bacterium]|nr:hypothetical protein [Lachnospiraceae bacterium]
MSEIVVDTYKLSTYAQRISDVNIRIAKLDEQLKTLYKKIQIKDLVELVKIDAMLGYSVKLERCEKYLYKTAAEFDAVENLIQSLDPLKFKKPNWGQRTAISILAHKDYIYDYLIDKIKNSKYIRKNSIQIGGSEFFLTDLIWAVNENIEEEDSGNVEVQYMTCKTKEETETTYFKYNNKFEFKYEKGPGMTINSDKGWSKEELAIIEKKYEVGIEGSVISETYRAENDWGKGELNVDVFTGEAHAGAAAGLYMYKRDDNGKLVRYFSPGVRAEAGVSCAAYSMDANGRIGLGEDKNLLGVYGKGELKAASGEAKAGVGINSNEVKAELSAEADLAKAEGTVGVSVLGADIGVTGAVKAGFGGHLEAGYTDGVIKLDVGAAFGVGGDVALEVDMSKPVEAVMDASYSFGGMIYDWLH